MANERTVVFNIYRQDTGAPLAGQVLAFAAYVDTSGIPRTPPAITDLGDGAYSFTPSEADVTAGVAYEFSCGSNASPTRMYGSVGYLVAFAIYNPAVTPYVPVPGLAPVFTSYQDLDGVERAPPLLFGLGSGLYGFLPTTPDYRTGITYTVQIPTGYAPEYVNGSIYDANAAVPAPPLTADLSGSAIIAAQASLDLAGGVALVAAGSLVVDDVRRIPFTGSGFDALDAPTPVELRMRDPFPYPALEEFRRRALATCTVQSDLEVQARTVSALALSGDQRGVFVNLLGPSSALLKVTDIDRRRLLDVERDLRLLDAVRAQALRELSLLGAPQAYLDVFADRLSHPNYTVRVVAICGVVLFAALLLQG